MDQLIIPEQSLIPITEYCYFSGNQSNYANYQNHSVTKAGNALIDVLEGVILLCNNDDKAIEKPTSTDM